MIFELNQMPSRSASGSSKGENKTSTYDSYLSDLFLTGIIERWVSFGRPRLELAAFIRSSGLFRTFRMNACRWVVLLWLNGSLSNVWNISMISRRSWRSVSRRLKFIVVTIMDSDGCASALNCVHRLRLSDLEEKLTVKHDLTAFSRGSSES